MPGSANPWATELKSRTVTRRQNSSGGSTSGASTASSGGAATAGAKPATSATDNNGTSQKDNEAWADDEEEEEGEWEWEEDDDADQEVAQVNGKTSNHTLDDGDDDDDDDDEDEEVKGVPDIKIQGNVIKIDRKDVVWSSDEYEESDEEEATSKIPVPPPPPPTKSKIPAPPPPPPPGSSNIPVPPPPPPGSVKNSGVQNGDKKKSNRVELLKQKPTNTPNWVDLMSEIEDFKYGFGGRLNKTKCNDRSGPILSTTKVGENFFYDSEKDLQNVDILKDIKKGVRLKRVRTNDRSKPFLRGIRSFKRQLTKEDRLKTGFSFNEDSILPEEEEDEDVDQIRDDLESTKQLLELEVRSKRLLEKDNKRLQAEMDKLRSDFHKLAQGGQGASSTTEGAVNGSGNAEATPRSARRASIASKRQSMIRLISESEDTSNIANASQPPTTNGHVAEGSVSPAPLQQPETSQTPEVPVEALETIELMQEEVDEARKLAEEWELKYKETQRQMADLDMARRTNMDKKLSTDSSSAMLRMQSVPSVDYGDLPPLPPCDDGDEEAWMQKRELHQLRGKLRNITDKREIAFRERRLLTDRVDSIVKNIGEEIEARKKVRAEMKEMNEAFKEELEDMEMNERTARELEECYFSDEEDLVVNPAARTRKSSQDEEDEYVDYEEEDVEETLDDIIKLAADGDDGEEDPGYDLFEEYPESEDEGEGDEDEDTDQDLEKQTERVNGKIDKHGDYLATMRKSNFMLKSKIDRLYDILQMQKEKHHDLNQELTRMLADIQ